MMRKYAIYLVVCLLVFGCTVGDDFKKPQLFENAEIEKALDLKPAKRQKQNYRLFDDEVLAKLIDMAFASSPSVRQALMRVKQARLSAKIAEVQGLPTLNAAGKYQYVNESKNIGLVYDEDVYQVGLDATWELDIFGGKRRQSEAAAASAYESIANLNNVYLSLASEVALSYTDLRRAQEDALILTQQIKINQQSLRLYRKLYRAGLTSEDKVAEAVIALEKTRTQYNQATQQVEQAKNKLALLTGKLPSSLDKLLAPQKQSLVSRPFMVDVVEFYQLPATVIETRPDVEAALYALKAQNAQVGVAIANLFPKVSLSGMLGFEALHSADLLKHKSYMYSYTPTLSVPLFYFGQLKNQVKVEQASYQEKLAAYEQTFLSAAAEIKDALIAMQSLQKQYDSATSSLARAERIYHLAEQKHGAGLTSQIELLTVKAQYFDAYQEWVASNAALIEAVVRFYKATGAVS